MVPGTAEDSGSPLLAVGGSSSASDVGLRGALDCSNLQPVAREQYAVEY